MSTSPLPRGLRPIWIRAGALSLPVVVVLALLVWTGQLRGLVAAISGVAMIGGLFLVVRRLTNESAAAIRYIDALASAPEVAVGLRPTDPLNQALVQAIDRLRESRHDGRDLEQTRARATADAALDGLPDGLVLLDTARRVVRVNKAAAELLGGRLLGGDLALTLRHPGVLEAVDAVLAGRATRSETEFALPAPRPRELVARVVAVPREGNVAGAVLVLHDQSIAKRVAQMRVDFIANASHELRTPLATLIGFIETLQGAAKDDAEARARFLGIMREQAERMARLVRDLLSLSRIELNERSAPQGRIDLRAVIREVADALSVQAHARNITVAIEAPETLLPAIGDRDELAQLFQNLIDNAIKYGRADGTVRVSLCQIAAAAPGGVPALSASVADEGEGIAREHLPRLTERFYRVDSARSQAMGGTGLGLAIVKHIVSRHRGTLKIDSQLGQGSVFTVILPATVA